MPKINYIEGDLFAAVNDHQNSIVIPHVCNSKGAWGAGFVIPLAKAYPSTRECYLNWFESRNSDDDPNEGKTDVLHTGTFSLGHVQTVLVESDVAVANMVAQTLGGKRPLSYKHLGRCMERVASYCKGLSFVGKTFCHSCPDPFHL